MATLGMTEAERAEIERFQRDVIEPSMSSLVILDFWAAWCGPCKMMAPVFEQAAAQLAGRVIMAKIDTDRAPASAARFDIRSIPTVILFSGGREVVRQAGALDLRRLLIFIENHL